MKNTLFRQLPAFVLLAASSLPGLGAQAADAPARPRVGLVLGGGGARGAAHIGVLEVLERLQVPVDCVAGTSMGALVAGAWAAGLSPEKMRAELAKADWNDLFIDDPAFSQQNFRKKEIDRRFLPASETGVGPSGTKYQTGVVTGQKIKLFFNELIHDNLGEREIERLPLPLSIIATDIVSGQRVVFRKGSLSTAMRSSMSVPGLMSPVDVDGDRLVDGGLVDNVPIGEARERCDADVIIAVNVGSPLLKADEIGGLLTISVQMVNILTEQNVTRSLATLKPTDIYIKPDLDGITAGDFQRSSETADRGVAAAEALADRLRGLSVDSASYAAWAQTIQMAKSDAPRIDAVEIAELKTVNPAVIERYLETKPGDILDPDKLHGDLMRAYGDGYYERVDYSLTTIRERNILRVTPVEKSWGPDYIRYGINLDTDFKADSTYSLRAAYQKTWLNPLGGELLVGAEIGSQSGVGVDYYQPLEARQRYFAETSFHYYNSFNGIYQNDQKLADYLVTRSEVRLNAGINIGLLGQARLGWEENWYKADLTTGVPIFPSGSTHYDGWFAAVDLDHTDRLYIPTTGWAARARYFDSPANNFSKLTAEARVFESIGDFVLSSRVSYQGSPIGRLPIYDLGSLGGFMNMTAMAVGQLKGDDITYANVRAEKIIGRLPMGLRGDMRLGVAYETAKIGNPATETQLTDWINSGAIYIGGETPLGPVYLGYGRSNAGSHGGYSNLYLFLGTP